MIAHIANTAFLFVMLCVAVFGGGILVQILAQYLRHHSRNRHHHI